jgi:hypothetical protein
MVATIATRTRSSSTILLSSIVFITASLCSIQLLIPVEKEASSFALQNSKQEFLQQNKKPRPPTTLGKLSSGGSSAASTVKTTTLLASSSSINANNTKNHLRHDESIVDNNSYINRNETNDKKKNKKKDSPPPPPPKYHVVFSTSCTDQQHWESMVFFYHAYKVQQPGTVTRIVSGCSDKERTEQDEFFAKYIAPMRRHDSNNNNNNNNEASSFHLHHTPDYSRLKLAEGQPYKYMNKRTYVVAYIISFLPIWIFVTCPPPTRVMRRGKIFFTESVFSFICIFLFPFDISVWFASLDGAWLGLEPSGGRE